jgi:pyruvate formate lyase activating enzyme
MDMRKAEFWVKEGGKVRCRLCPRECAIPEGKNGFCSVRKNVKGNLVSLVYGKPCSISVDPIEKKPLFHFAPGTACLSLATVGCNLDCSFCQNHEISHPRGIFGNDMGPEEVVEMARRYDVPGIAYTYTEPTIFFEYAYDIMRLARKAGLYNVWVSNGYINPGPARKAAKYMDAINVDLKGNMNFYNKLCGITDELPIRKALKVYKKSGVWIEATNLVIPGHNDRPENFRELSEWVKRNLGPGTPLHFSRFYPMFRMRDAEPTPLDTLERAADIAREAGMEYVYIGNFPGHERESTYCPKCGEKTAERSGHGASSFSTVCQKCGNEIPVAGEKWIAK